MAVLLILNIALYYSWWTENIDLSSRILWAFICVYIILFSLSITRINTVIANLAFDPIGETSPYRPHPGRRNLAAFFNSIICVIHVGITASQMQYYLAFAASAGFMDRAAEWFIGKAAFKMEVLCLMLANISASLGFLLIGLSGFNSEISPYLGLHILTIGSLGLWRYWEYLLSLVYAFRKNTDYNTVAIQDGCFTHCFVGYVKNCARITE